MNIVRFQLDAKRELRRRRETITPVQTVTPSPPAPSDNESDPERPLIGPEGILEFVHDHQGQAHEKLEPEMVMMTIIFLGTYEW